jgi:Peptidase family M28
MMMRLLRLVLSMACLAVVADCHGAGVNPTPAPIDAPDPAPPGAAELRRDLMVLASDSFRGREAGTADERRAAGFLAARAAALGLSPAGDSGYIQRVPLVRTSLGAGTRFTVRPTQGPVRSIEELRPLMELGPGLPPIRRQADGALVFVGYGLERGSRGDDLAHVPIAGHVVVVVNGAPTSADAAQRAELESPAAIAVRLQRILPLHPAAVILLLTGASADVYEAGGRALRHGTVRLAVPSADTNGTLDVAARPVSDAATTPMILLGLPARGSPLLPAHWPHDARPQLLHAGRFTGTVELQRTPVVSYNVVASIPGRDTARRGTWVALSAHYDHLGILPAVNGDSVAHGADDDGSGCVALLAVARAMMQSARTARSMLFIWHTGEEQGLLGSEYFTSHPTIPIDSMVAFIDADMVGRNAPESLYVVGPNTAPQGRSRVLGVLVDSVNATLPAPFAFNRDWDVPTDPQRIYYRADTYPYGERGVPVVLLTSGPHADYHQVTDVASRIDYAKLTHVARFLFALTDALSNRAAAPRP